MKWDKCEQDIEDFEQEKQIQEWLSQNGNGEFEFKHITSKGTARNTLIKAAFSLDQEISVNGSSTFSDLIAGSDGRDLECGPITDELEPDAREKISGYLFALGFNQGDVKWIIKTLQLSTQRNKSHFEKSLIDSEW